MESINQIVGTMPWNKKIELLRITKGWSQDEAAIQCGTSQKNYWLWERGKSYPHYNNRRCIAMAFGVKVDEIFPIKAK